MTEGQGGSAPAGWYPDPDGNGERWWNGTSWAESRPAQAPAQTYPPQQPYAAQPEQGHPQQLPRHQGLPQQAQQQGQQGYSGSQGGSQLVQPVQHPQQPQQPAAGMRCLNCQFTDFSQAEFALNPFNTTANCLICRRCGFIHWFAR